MWWCVLRLRFHEIKFDCNVYRISHLFYYVKNVVCSAAHMLQPNVPLCSCARQSPSAAIRFISYAATTRAIKALVGLCRIFASIWYVITNLVCRFEFLHENQKINSNIKQLETVRSFVLIIFKRNACIASVKFMPTPVSSRATLRELPAFCVCT